MASSRPEIDARALEVARFWRDAGPDMWFRKSDDFDGIFSDRFLDLHYAAARRECDGWLEHSESALALIVLLDQLPRNCFRGTGHMYATDPLARHFARRCIEFGHDLATEGEIRVFFYLPFSHSEVLADHHIPLKRSAALGGEYEKHAIWHYEIVKRFGRFPHRNEELGRETTPDEQAFLDKGGFAG
jgi:uncharacterized protein (DUF924 family)